MSKTNILIAVLSLCLLSGCGDDRLQTGSVSGTVLLDGKPVDNAEIIFSGDKRMALGGIVEGKIVNVTTYTSGDGVLVGERSVAIRPKIDIAELMKPPTASSKKKSRKSKIPVMYHKGETSGLKVEIKAGENPVSFELTSDK